MSSEPNSTDPGDRVLACVRLVLDGDWKFVMVQRLLADSEWQEIGACGTLDMALDRAREALAQESGSSLMALRQGGVAGLRPCPFCGSSVHVTADRSTKDHITRGVLCKSCGAFAPLMRWNERNAKEST